MKMIYEFVGGRYNGMRMPREAVEAIGNGRFSKDWSKERDAGGLVPMEELDNQPLIDGYLAPMWDGIRMDPVTMEQYAVLRYETQGVYDMLSR